MARTLILNISAQAQTLPAAYGSFSVAVGHGRVVADETSLVVTGLGGFAAMDGVWIAYPVSTDTTLGDFDVAADGVAMLATFIPGASGGGGSGPAAWADITGKPAFSAVATSGSYADLSDTPVLADVATSGAYADLSGTPTLPSASNTAPANVAATGAAGVQASYARADHQHAHGNLSGGSLHSAATTIAAGFMSAADKTALDQLVSDSQNATGVFAAPMISLAGMTGDYNDLVNKPTLFSGAYADLSGKPTLFSGAYADLTGKPTLFSGSYADLTNKPSLFSGAYADLTGKPSFATVATSGSYNDLSNKPSKTYDIASYTSETLTVGTVIAKVLAPRNLTLSALSQSGGATVKVQVNNVDAVYPQSVTTGQTISVVVSVAGTASTFTISAVEA